MYNKLLFTTTVLLSVLFYSNSVIAQNGTGTKETDLNTAKSSIEWTGKKVLGQHNGKVSISKGSLITKNNVLGGGSFVIDMKSITCDDIKDADYNKKLVGHLNSTDFFNVTEFPTATLKITKVLKINNKPNAYNLTADLSIKGITKSITFPATFSKTGNIFEGNAMITIDRTLWDIKYGSSNFFEGLGDKAIKNEIELNVNIVSN